MRRGSRLPVKQSFSMTIRNQPGFVREKAARHPRSGDSAHRDCKTKEGEGEGHEGRAFHAGTYRRTHLRQDKAVGYVCGSVLYCVVCCSRRCCCCALREPSLEPARFFLNIQYPPPPPCGRSIFGVISICSHTFYTSHHTSSWR